MHKNNGVSPSLKYGEQSRPSESERRDHGRSFVTIMLVIGVVALALRIGLEQIVKTNIVSNESSASATLKLISTALENYAKNNANAFPTSIAALTQTNPAYLDKDYTLNSSVQGYVFSCVRLDAAGYSCYAAPTHCNLTGNKIFNVTTGGLFVSEECSVKKE